MTEHTLNLDQLPAALRQQIDGSIARRILLGESGVDVYRLQSANAATRYLKIEARSTLRELHLERDRLVWLRGKLPVPEVLFFGDEHDTQYLLLSAIEGVDASQLVAQSDPVQMIAALAGGLQQIHAVDYHDCPFDRRLDHTLAEVEVRVQRQLVDEDDFDDERRGDSAQRLYARLQSTRPRHEDLIFVHGDYCFPNILLDPKTLAVNGFIDWGRSGIADRYQDLALAARSIVRNLSERWVGHFFEVYGLDRVDVQKIRYYQLLDEFF
jgi:aminoglycoside phosphotransferase